MNSTDEGPSGPLLDYATPHRPSLRQLLVRASGYVHDAGPWLVWPSVRTMVVLAVVALAVVWFDRRPHAWQRLKSLPPMIGGYELIVTPQGKLLFTGGEGLKPRLVDPDPDVADIPLESADFKFARLSGDGRIVFSFDDHLRTWDAVTGKLLAESPRDGWPLDNATRQSGLRAWDLSGSRFVEAYANGVVLAWDVSDLSAPRLLARSEGVASPNWPVGGVSLTPDGRHVLIVDNSREAVLAETDTLKTRWSKPAPDLPIKQILARLSPDGQTLVVVTTAERQYSVDVQLINVSDLRERAAFVYGGIQCSVGFSPLTGNLLLGSFGRVDSVYDIRKGRHVPHTWSPSGSLVADEPARRNTAQGETSPVYFAPSRNPNWRYYNGGAALFPDGRHVATYEPRRGGVEIWRRMSDATVDPPVLKQPRFWALIALSPLLAWSVTRDIAFRGRRRFVAATLAAAGSIALVFILAAMSWSGDWSPAKFWRDQPVVFSMILGLPLAYALGRGGVGWLWFVRVLFAAIVVGILCWTRPDSTMSVNALDLYWRMRGAGIFTAAACGCVIAIIGCALLVGVPRRPQEVNASRAVDVSESDA